MATFYAGHPERALAAQQRALALSPNDVGSYDYLLELLVRTNQFSEALRVYEQAQSRYLDTNGFRFLAAIAAWGDGDLSEAERLFSPPREESNDYTDVVNTLYLGRLLAFQGHIRKAEGKFRAGLGLCRRPGFEYWEKVFQYQLASTELVRSLSDSRPDVYRYVSSVRHATTAGTLERAGSLLLRIADVKSASSFKRLIDAQIKIHDDTFSEMESHALAGEIALAGGNWKQAVQEEETALNLQEGYEPLLILGQACRAGEDWGCAIDAYKRYLEMKGAVLRYDVASDWVTAHYGLAQVYSSSGDRQHAIEYGKAFLSSFSEADPDLPILARARKYVSRLENEDLKMSPDRN